MDQDCPSHLIHDEPSEKDELGGSHERVAKLITDTITSEEGGRAIALVGPYGSGKSTVIRLVERSFIAKGDTALFQFDAWAHQGDPLRRSFLEALHEFLRARRWINPGDFSEAMEQLASRVQRTESVSSPKLTRSGAAVALSFLGIPIGDIIGRLCLPLAILLVALPAILMTIIWCKNSRRPDVLKLLYKEVDRTTTSTSTSKPDPTSIEFHNLFSKLLSAALSDERRRLVVALDNLDRLRPEDVLDVFATMRTFVDGALSGGVIQKKVWLVIPFAPSWSASAVATLIQGDDPSDSLDDTSKEATAATPAKDHGSSAPRRPGIDAERAFLEKAFQVTTHISAPRLSDWKQRLQQLLAQALPKHSGDFDMIYLVYDQLSAVTKRQHTPRSLTQFVNAISTLHREWAHNIPLPVMAAYALQPVETAHDLEKLISGYFLEQSVAPLLPEDWQKYFAALYLNVEPERALSDLIADAVRQAISMGDGAALSQLGLPDDVKDQCIRIIASDYTSWKLNPSILANAASAMAALNLTNATAWKQLCLAASTAQRWRYDPTLPPKGIVALLDHAAQDQQTAILSALLESLSHPNLDEEALSSGPPDGMQNWLGIASPIALWGVSREPKLLQDSLRVPGAPEDFLDLLSSDSLSRPSYSSLLPFLQPTCDKAAIVAALVTRLRNDSDDLDIKLLLDRMQQISQSWPFSDLEEALHEDVSGGVLPYPRLKAALVTLQWLSHATYANKTDAFASLSASGALLTQLPAAKDTPELLAYLLFVCFSSGYPNSPLTPGHGVIASLAQDPSASNETVLQELARLATRDKATLDSCVASWSARPDLDPIMAAVLRTLVPTSGSSVAPSSTERLLPDFSTFHGYLRRLLSTDAYTALLAASIQQGDLEQQIAAASFTDEDLDLYHDMLTNDITTIDTAFIDFVTAGLRSVPRSIWTATIRDNTPNTRVDIVQALLKINCREFLATETKAALYDVAKELLGETPPEEPSALCISALSSALEVSYRQTLLRDLRDLLIGSTASLDTFIISFGSELASAPELPEKADEVVRSIFTRVLETPCAESLIWIRDVIRQQPTLLEQAKPASLDTFRDLILSLLNDDKNEGSCRSALMDLANLLGIAQVGSTDESVRDDGDGSEPAPAT